MKLDTNEWEATVDSWRMFPDYDMIDYDRIRIDDIKTFIHQQLQKARQDWLREEIVRLEGMKKSQSPMHDAHQFYKVQDHNQALDAVITNYKNELK